MSSQPESPIGSDARLLREDTEAFLHFPTGKQLLEAPKMIVRLVRVLERVARRVELLEGRVNDR